MSTELLLKFHPPLTQQSNSNAGQLIAYLTVVTPRPEYRIYINSRFGVMVKLS
jgi:hypothetical protein